MREEVHIHNRTNQCDQLVIMSKDVSLCWTTGGGLISYRISTASTAAIIFVLLDMWLDYCQRSCNMLGLGLGLGMCTFA